MDIICCECLTLIRLDYFGGWKDWGYFILTMLLHARNQTFFSKSVNTAPKMDCFGLDTLCSILSNGTEKKLW